VNDLEVPVSVEQLQTPPGEDEQGEWLPFYTNFLETGEIIRLGTNVSSRRIGGRSIVRCAPNMCRLRHHGSHIPLMVLGFQEELGMSVISIKSSFLLMRKQELAQHLAVRL
jgi:hypothetical protein